MRLAIVGSRTFTDADLMWRTLNSARINGGFDEFVSGGAAGADTVAREWAQAYGFTLIEHLPDWERHGKAAGFIRNQKIIADADALVAFFGPDGPTKGTDHSIRLARAKRIPIHIYWQEAA